MIYLFFAYFTVLSAQQPENNPFNPDLAWKPKTDIQESFDADFMVMMATMFPKSYLAGHKIGSGYKSAVDRQDFVKRLYLLLLLNPPKFRLEKAELNQAKYDHQTQSVSYLMRGRRWMIDFTGIPAEDVFNFLTGSANISFNRTFASHGAHINKNGYIIEDKLTGVKTYQTFTHGILKRHKGVNIPLGGYGNFAINKSYLIGADGRPVDPAGKILKSKIQHGHVYTYVQTFGRKPVPDKATPDIRSVLLIGIEPAAPGYKSMFKVEHNAASGFKDSTLDPSLTNSKKWRHSKISIQPADYNGMLTSMDINAVLQWEHACKRFLSLPLDVQHRFMEKWLRLPAQQLSDQRNEIMKDIFDESRQDIQKPTLLPKKQQQPTQQNTSHGQKPMIPSKQNQWVQPSPPEIQKPIMPNKQQQLHQPRIPRDALPLRGKISQPPAA